MTTYCEKCGKCGMEITSGEEPINRNSQEWEIWNDEWYKAVDEFKDHRCGDEVINDWRDKGWQESKDWIEQTGNKHKLFNSSEVDLITKCAVIIKREGYYEIQIKKSADTDDYGKPLLTLKEESLLEAKKVGEHFIKE